MQIDFEEFEKVIVEKFQKSLKPKSEGYDGPDLSDIIGSMAARVATLAIKEYHDRIQSEKQSI